MDENTEQSEIRQIVRKPVISASCGLWKAFNDWCKQYGYKGLPEGFRAMVKEVTGFKPESQEKTLIGGGRVV